MQIDPICIMDATQVLKGLNDEVAGEIVVEAYLELHERRRLVSCNEVNFLPRETAVLGMNSIAAGGPR
jgi:hypothetical protein